MTLQLSAPALAQIQAIVASTDPQRFAQAYAIALQDLSQTTTVLSASDQDVMQWLSIAKQVNSGDKTLASVAIRANNVAAEFLENGKVISLFGVGKRSQS
jgi:hypothetical protein